MGCPIPPDETERLAALHALQILDTPPAREFETLVRLARDLLDVPISAISLVDEHRQWFKAVDGFDCRELPRDVAFCAHAICSAEPLIVEDATRDDRFRQSPLVTESPGIRFYAGVPLQLVDGLRFGSLCVIDTRPRVMSGLERLRLQQLGEMATALLKNHAGAIQNSRQAKIIDDQEQRLLKSHNLLASAFELGKLGAWERDMATGQLTWSEGMFKLSEMEMGTERGIAECLELYPEPERTRLAAVIAEADRAKQPFRFEGRMYTAQGKMKWVRLVSEVELDGDRLIRRYGLKQDLTEEKVLLERVKHLANSDELTGLANRRALRRKLAEVRKSADLGIVLLALDLDGFKEINDTHGHAAGDAYLRRIGRRLKTAMGPEMLVARTGGDEFALIRTGPDATRPDRLVERVLKAIQEPVIWRGHSFRLSCSIGAATREAGGCFVPDELLHEADLALYEAKRDGKNCWRLFRTELETAAIERKAVLKSVREGLRLDRFRLFYQPKLCLTNGAHSGFEALLRCIADDGSVLTPGSFSAALEDASLSRALGDFVMEAAVQQARAWARAGVAFGHIAINLSASQLKSPDFARQLLDRLAALDLPSRLVSVEVTEGVFLSAQADVVTANCRALREGGINIAFDDFGTGYASLTHLRDFPVDTIKIDRSFVAGLNKGESSVAIVNAIVGLGNNLGLDVVAEGVETQAQLEFLAAIGCRYAQGFLFGRPVSAEDAQRMLLRPVAVAPKAA